MDKKTAEKQKNMSIDELAIIVQRGFLGLEEKMTNQIDDVKSELRKEIREAKDELKSNISNVRADLNKKVDIFTHKELEYRVEKLEEKAGAMRKG